jgi:hypothetical protein
MSPLPEFDQSQEEIVRETALRIVIRRWAEFDAVWEAAIRLCDAYGIGKS